VVSVFCGPVHAPAGSQANISNDFAQNTQQQRHFDETAVAAGEKHDIVDVQDVVSEVGSCVLACSCSCDLFLFILFLFICLYLFCYFIFCLFFVFCF
jgi:hypothetical protein